MFRYVVNVAFGHAHILRKRSVARHSEYRGIGTPDALVVSPANRRIEQNPRAAGFTRSIGAENPRKVDLRIQALRNEDVAMIERRSSNAHKRFSALGLWL